MSKYSVDSFAQAFGTPPDAEQRAARETRTRKERRAQLTERQRSRGAVRTTQINFRCSPAFKQLAHDLSDFLDGSIADTLEEALNLLAKTKGYKRGKDAG